MTKPSRSTGSVAELELERAFLLAMTVNSSDLTWVGLSSKAMVVQALTGADEPSAWPADRYDLERCEKAYQLAPIHLKERMLPTLEAFRREVRERSYHGSTGR